MTDLLVTVLHHLKYTRTKKKKKKSVFSFIKFHIHQYVFSCNTKKEIKFKSDDFLQRGQGPSKISPFSVGHYCNSTAYYCTFSRFYSFTKFISNVPKQSFMPLKDEWKWRKNVVPLWSQNVRTRCSVGRYHWVFSLLVKQTWWPQKWSEEFFSIK